MDALIGAAVNDVGVTRQHVDVAAEGLNRDPKFFFDFLALHGTPAQDEPPLNSINRCFTGRPVNEPQEEPDG